MFRNYLLTAFRNLLHNKGRFFVNIIGLTVSFSAFLLIFLVLAYEQSYDGYHAKKNRIYRVVRESRNSENGGYSAGASFPLAATLRKVFPQIEQAAAIYGDKDVQVIIPGSRGETLRKFKEHRGVFMAEPQVFDIFDFKVLDGDTRSLSAPNTAVITKDFATRYFGNWQQAIGKAVKLYDQQYNITGVIDNPPANSDLPLGLVVSYATVASLGIDMNDWVEFWTSNYCFITLKPGISGNRFDAQLPGFIARYAPQGTPEVHLQPLHTIHSDRNFGNFNGRTFTPALSTSLKLIAIFLLIIACVNFINVTTASAINRAREVGVRKALGSSRWQLMLQFLGEVGVTCLLAMTGALLVVLICMPFLSELLGIKLSLTALDTTGILVFIPSLVLTVTLLAGFYPALILSGFNPITALKSRPGGNPAKGIMLRRVLVVCQFAIAQVLIIGTLVVVSQMKYFNNADMGFSKEAIVKVDFPRDSVSLLKLPVLQNELLQQPGISAVSFSAYAPVDFSNWSTDLRLSSNHTNKPDLIVHMKPADTGYFRIYQLQMAAGNIYAPSDTMKEFVVNEKLVKDLGIASPEAAIGMPIYVMDKPGIITGVVKNYNITSMREPIGPVVMTTLNRSYRAANIRIKPGETKATLAAIKSTWDRFFPDYVFEYNFIDETIAQYYKQEEQLAQLYKIFAGLSIFISCLGLYGLVSFMAEQRKKEIGIRKVLGAPVSSILYLLSREFTLLIIIAFAIAAPLAWYFMQEWLQQYSFRITMGPGFFVITLLASVLIAWLSVGHSAIKAAIANPVKSLTAE